MLQCLCCGGSKRSGSKKFDLKSERDKHGAEAAQAASSSGGNSGGAKYRKKKIEDDDRLELPQPSPSADRRPSKKPTPMLPVANQVEKAQLSTLQTPQSLPAQPPPSLENPNPVNEPSQNLANEIDVPEAEIEMEEVKVAEHNHPPQSVLPVTFEEPEHHQQQAAPPAVAGRSRVQFRDEPENIQVSETTTVDSDLKNDDLEDGAVNLRNSTGESATDRPTAPVSVVVARHHSHETDEDQKAAAERLSTFLLAEESEDDHNGGNGSWQTVPNGLKSHAVHHLEPLVEEETILVLQPPHGSPMLKRRQPLDEHQHQHQHQEQDQGQDLDNSGGGPLRIRSSDDNDSVARESLFALGQALAVFEFNEFEDIAAAVGNPMPVGIEEPAATALNDDTGATVPCDGHDGHGGHGHGGHGGVDETLLEDEEEELIVPLSTSRDRAVVAVA